MSSTIEIVHLKIDGEAIAVPAAKTAYDAQFRKNVEVPTTVYDASLALAKRRFQAEKETNPGTTKKEGDFNPIPILCHREHINPVAVCRMCMVDVAGRAAPACYRPVEQNMDVKTAATSERIRTAVRTLTHLLLADHLPGQMPSHKDNELEQLALRQNLYPAGKPEEYACPFPRAKDKRLEDESSPAIAVDHNACILCDRCVRACNEIKHNEVIGRAGKGYKAQIAFDLNNPMGSSTCVACGECAVSCPTGALLHKTQVKPEVAWQEVSPAPQKIPADELIANPLFEGVSPAFLRWNEGAVVRRTFKKGEIICREGDFGATAFLIEKGRVRIFLQSPQAAKAKESNGWLSFIRRFSTALVPKGKGKRHDDAPVRFINLDAPINVRPESPAAFLEVGDMFGEMACMNRYPRSATVVAEEDCTVLEMLSNVLYILQRNAKSREWLEERYRARSVESHLRGVPLFMDVLQSEAEIKRFVDFLRPRVALRRIGPGEVIFREGDPADNFYMVRVGFVKVSQDRPGGVAEVRYISPGGFFGELGLLSMLPEADERIRRQAGRRSATCSALDHVDLISVPPDIFQEMVREFPSIKQHLIERSRQFPDIAGQPATAGETVPLADFLEQGLMNGQSLLVLDLEKCTRCDECTKACSDSHDGTTRLIREGLRLDKWLVASSCRSCLDPYCMIGCPVNSIRRRQSKEIIIEPWCIGCGLCSNNCPYGNINMVEVDQARGDGRRMKATVCDLCSDLDGNPSCVYACPHDAAHRMTGLELLEKVKG